MIEDIGLVLEFERGTRLILAEQVLAFEVRKADISQVESSRPTGFPVFLPSPSKVEASVGQINSVITKAISNGDQQLVLPPPPPSNNPVIEKPFFTEPLLDVPEYAISNNEQQLALPPPPPSNNPVIEKSFFTEPLLDVPEYAFDRFTELPVIVLPEPVFTFEVRDKHIEQQLDKCMQIYSYAVKIKELSRIHSILPVVNGLANSSSSATLYALCGHLALKVDDKHKARENFAACFRLDPGKLIASLGLAQLHVEKQEWESAARYLCCAKYFGEVIDDNLKHNILLNLGKCISHSSNKEIQGLAAIAKSEDSTQTVQVALALIAMALQHRHPEAAKAAFANRLVIAQSLAPSSSIFGQISKLIDDLQNELKPLQIKTTPVSAKRITSIVTWKGGEAPKKEYRQPPIKPGKNSPITLATSSTPYAKAKRFEQEGDFDSAKVAYWDEINRKGSRLESAVKDLASLHNRLGEDKQAIEILDKYRSGFSDTKSLDNLKSTVLVKAKRFKEAASLFAQMQNRESGQRKQNLMRQQAYCLSMLREFESALKLLSRLKNESPFDLLTDSLIEKIKLLRDHGIQSNSETAVLSDLMAFASGISAFAKSLISQCDLRLVDDRSKARGYFEEQDFRRLEDQLERLRGRIPQQRAEINLTLAAICQISPENANDRSSIDYLRNSLQYLGEAAINDNLHEDTARCYLAESLSLATDTHVDFGLSYLLATYLTVRPAPGELHASSKDGRVYVESVLKRFEKDTIGWARFQKDFSYYSMISPGVTRRLSQELSRLRTLTNFISTLPDLNGLQMRENDRCRVESTNLTELASRQLGPEVLNNMAEKLREYAETTRFSLDKQRLLSLANISTEAARYWRESDYSERVAKYGRLVTNLSGLTSEIGFSPTKLSAERMVPIAKAMEAQAEQN